MRESRDFLKELWYDLAGKTYTKREKYPSLEELKKTQWDNDFEYLLRRNNSFVDDEFIQFMRNRMIMGSFRYGLMEDQDYGRFDLVQYIRDKQKSFYKTKNLECLVDAANNCLIMFVHGKRLNHEYIYRKEIITIESALMQYKETSNLFYTVYVAKVLMKMYIVYKWHGCKMTALDDKEHAKERI